MSAQYRYIYIATPTGNVEQSSRKFVGTLEKWTFTSAINTTKYDHLACMYEEEFFAPPGNEEKEITLSMRRLMRRMEKLKERQ